MHTRARYGDNDKHFGPFTYGKSNYTPISVVLTSGDGEDRKGCELQINLRGYYLVVGLPSIVRPYREKVVPQSWDAATIARLGRDWYWHHDERRYGFSLSSDGGIGSTAFLNVWLGRQTDDSSTEQRWSCFLPWTDLRHIRKSLYDLEGKHYWTDWHTPRLGERNGWQVSHAVEKSCPKAIFEIEDYDGKRILVSTHIEEREWRFGTKRFKWLSLFRKPLIRRSLSLDFAQEVGPEKGSWKGGLRGTGIEMLPGELHEAAFRRYCEQEHNARGRKYRIAFVGVSTAKSHEVAA